MTHLKSSLRHGGFLIGWPSRQSKMQEGLRLSKERYQRGGRNDTLFRDGCALRRRGATEEEILAYIREVNKGRCEPPLSDQELRKIAHSACGYTPARLGSVSPQIPTLDSAAMYGLAGKVVNTLLPHTEADGPALLLHLLAGYGNMIGPHAYCDGDGAKHHANLFFVCVGETAKGRKGTSWNRIREILKQVDHNWAHDHIQSGLSSGEGLVTAAAHAGVAQLDTDSSTAEKLLLIVQSEFASVLKVMTRQGNTLSAVIRDAWDTGSFQIMVKKNPLKVDNAHITIIAHITREELKHYLTLNEYGNGFANRFLWARSSRSKCLPEGGHLGDGEITELVTLMTAAVQFGRNAGLMQRDPEAKELWAEVYPKLSEGQLGLFGAVTSRAEAQVLRLSMIYALLDSSPEIRRPHLEAALALWSYCEQTAWWIFGGESGDPLADEIFAALIRSGEMTQNDINNHFNRHQTSDTINKSLALLRTEGKVHPGWRPTKGRRARVWKAVEVEEPATILEDDRELDLLEDDEDPRDNI